MNNKEFRSLIESLMYAAQYAYMAQQDLGSIGNQTIIQQQELTMKKAEELFNSTPEKDDGVFNMVWIKLEEGENCRGCGKQLQQENAWMEDGCPCNSPRGVNSKSA